MKAFDIVPANLWRENKHVEDDLRLLSASRVDVVACNESANWVEQLKNVVGYTTIIGPGSKRPHLNNVILLREDHRVIDSGARKMCDEAGGSPIRYATWVAFWWDGVKVAVICTHVNAGIQEGPNNPTELPRTREAIEHVKNLGALRKELSQRFDTVIIAGDLNWDYEGGPLTKQWYYAPRRYFARWGMTTNWADPSALKGGSLGRRQIDYVAFKPSAWRIVRQAWVRGEHSDHNWPRISLYGRRRPFRRWRIRHLGAQG